MNPAQSADSKRVTLPRFPKEGVVPKFDWCQKAIIKLAAAAGIQLQIVGASRASVGHDGQVQLGIRAGSASAPSSEMAFTVRDNYSIVPGTIGGKMPTIGGVRLDAATPPTLSVSSSGTRYGFFVLNFSPSYNNGYLSSYTLDSVSTLVSSSASPSDTDSVKHLHFVTFTDGVPSNPLVTSSPLPISLWDNGYGATLLRVGNL